MALKKAIKTFMALREFIQKKREEQVQEPEKAKEATARAISAKV